MNNALRLIKYGKIWDSLKIEEKKEYLQKLNILDKYLDEFSIMKWEELHPNTKWIFIDCLEEKEEKIGEELFDFARMVLTIKKGYTGIETKTTSNKEVTELLNSFQQQARDKGFMFGISSFRMENN